MCWEEEPSEELYALPCACKGELGVIHTHCFATWMSHTPVAQCDICHTPLPVTVFDPEYCCLLYSLSLGFLYYCLFVLACAVHWISRSPVPQFSDISVFVTIVLVMHPVVVFLIGMLALLHHHVSHPYHAGGIHNASIFFLKTRGRRVT